MGLNVARYWHGEAVALCPVWDHIPLFVLPQVAPVDTYQSITMTPVAVKPKAPDLLFRGVCLYAGVLRAETYPF